MAALAKRAFVAAGGDFYLCPLSQTQQDRAERLKLLQPIELVAKGFYSDVALTATIEHKPAAFEEPKVLLQPGEATLGLAPVVDLQGLLVVPLTVAEDNSVVAGAEFEPGPGAFLPPSNGPTPFAL